MALQRGMAQTRPSRSPAEGLSFGRREKAMQSAQLHESIFLKILWDGKTRVIGIDWKEATSSMTDEDFKNELTLFADHVEQKRARGILVDISHFRHKMGP